ncbi:MAG: class I SAM-dependent methyltransferase, partial [Anaerolineales bacterium]|nr:class I SAM-dependent methyltransferase [Anaerolineales bacterium]
MKITFSKTTKAILRLYLTWMNRRAWIPLRVFMGSGNGKSVSRAYVEKFIETNKSLITGDILEIGRNVYKCVVLPENIVSYSCLDIAPFPDIDIVADIQNMKNVESDKFDTIICTQVLEHVPNPFSAVDELYRILRPGGRLFITVPFLNNYHMEPDDYWRFTEYALAFLLKNFLHCTTASYGSTYHHIMATLG